MEKKLSLLTEGLETKDEVKKTRPLWSELLFELCIILVVAFLTYAFVGLKIITLEEHDLNSITYSVGKQFKYSTSLLKASSILSFVSTLLLFGFMYLFRPSGIKPMMGKHGKLLISEIILSLFGVLAFIVIALFVGGFGIDGGLAILLSSIIVSVYDILIYKLDAEGMTYSNKLFWEIFRFAIVGLVASVFDFATCFILQFVLFKGNHASYVTGIATTGGFIIGVIINYLMSTYMVYKAAKTNTGKTFKGMVIFLVLAIIGLLIGIGIQYVLYDFLFVKKGVSFLSYPVDFVIRTLIVMVYNYISRKIFIYK